MSPSFSSLGQRYFSVFQAHFNLRDFENTVASDFLWDFLPKNGELRSE